MKGLRLALPSPAMAVALCALFVAMGGTGYAATQLTRPIARVATATKPKKPKSPSDTATDSALIKKLASRLSVAQAATATYAVNAARAAHATVADGAAPMGAAGGSLAGSYPNPTIAAGAVTPTTIGAAPAAVVTNTSNVTVPNKTLTLISFDTDQVNLDGVHSTGSNPGRLTAPIDGLYAVHGEADWSPCTANGAYEEIQIRVNDQARVGVTAIPKSTTSCTAEGVQALVHLKAGDYVSLDAYQASGSSETILGTVADNNPDTPEFDMRWVGPAS